MKSFRSQSGISNSHFARRAASAIRSESGRAANCPDCEVLSTARHSSFIPAVAEADVVTNLTFLSPSTIQAGGTVTIDFAVNFNPLPMSLGPITSSVDESTMISVSSCTATSELLRLGSDWSVGLYSEFCFC
jgi:hypothetical protein